MKSPHQRGIIRVDIPAKFTHGWQVVLKYRGLRAPTKFFSDSKHGGIDGSFGEAQLYRDEWRAALVLQAMREGLVRDARTVLKRAEELLTI